MLEQALLHITLTGLCLVETQHAEWAAYAHCDMFTHFLYFLMHHLAPEMGHKPLPAARQRFVDRFCAMSGLEGAHPVRE